MDAASLPERGDPPASLLDLLVQQRGTEGAGSGIR